MSAQEENLKDKAKEVVDEAQKAGTDAVDEGKAKAEDAMKKAAPKQESGKSG